MKIPTFVSVGVVEVKKIDKDKGFFLLNGACKAVSTYRFPMLHCVDFLIFFSIFLLCIFFVFVCLFCCWPVSVWGPFVRFKVDFTSA